MQIKSSGCWMLPNDSRLGFRDRALFEVLYSAGLRVSELVGLNIDDINLEAGTLKVFGKGKRERLALIGQHATAALVAWLSVRGDGEALFVNYKGGRLSTRSVQKIAGEVYRPGWAGRGDHSAPPCGIPSPLTCWTMVPTSGPSRKCSATSRSRQRKSTPTYQRAAAGRLSRAPSEGLTMKIKPTDAGSFVTVYNEGQGKTDAILLEVSDDVAEVWYPHLLNDAGGAGARDLVETKSIVALGPPVAVHVPLF